MTVPLVVLAVFAVVVGIGLGPTHLFASPVVMLGAMPGSAVDWQIRIDYLQHAGSMMVRWLEIRAAQEKPRKGDVEAP